MGFFRAIFCIILPPLAVLDKGCGSILLVFFLTLLGWLPGVLAALIICTRQDKVVVISNGGAPIAVQTPKNSLGTITGLICAVFILACAGKVASDGIKKAEPKAKTPIVPQNTILASLPESGPSSATAADSQAEALRRYPALGIKDSAFNKAFLARYNQAKASNPGILTQPDWPMRLADQTATQLQNQPSH